MNDLRIDKLVKNILTYSLNIKKGEKILIEGKGSQSSSLIKALLKECYALGAIPFYNINDQSILADFLKHASKEQIILQAEKEATLMKQMDCYIGFSAPDNLKELAGVSGEKMNLWMKYYVEPVHHRIRINKTRWIVLRYPTNALAQAADLCTSDFENLFFKVCNLDYISLSEKMNPLVELMESTKKVHIKGPDTDLSFLINDIPVVKCDGHRNIPDGEIYTAPVKESLQGRIKYNVPSEYQGFRFTDVEFYFEKGKIIQAKANDSKRLNEILDIDEGARYVGEFSLGLNPCLYHPINDTLFDEKIAGSFHLTPGNCYSKAPNGNKSSIHWDLVSIQRKDYGGGEIWFDDQLIRHNGLFILPDLLPLNYEEYDI